MLFLGIYSSVHAGEKVEHGTFMVPAVRMQRLQDCAEALLDLQLLPRRWTCQCISSRLSGLGE